MIYFNGVSLVADELYGVQRNTLEILKCLDAVIEPGNVSVLIPSGHEYQFGFVNIDVIELPQTSMGIKWGQIYFPRYVKKHGIGVDLLLSIPARGCDVLCIYDCITEKYPENWQDVKSKLGRLYHILRVKMALKRSTLVLSDSRAAANEIARYYSFPRESIHVIPCGWQHILNIEEDAEILHKLKLSEKSYYFSLGSRYVHKNFRWIVEVARKYADRTFVVTGTASLSSTDGISADSIPSNVLFTGYLSDSEIKALMRHCLVFIQPSLCEGFGIPPMEAMAVGADCMLSDIPVFHEIYGDSVWYFDPLDYDGIDIDAIMGCERQRSAQSVLQHYSWEKSAKELLSLLLTLDYQR